MEMILDVFQRANRLPSVTQVGERPCWGWIRERGSEWFVTYEDADDGIIRLMFRSEKYEDVMDQVVDYFKTHPDPLQLS